MAKITFINGLLGSGKTYLAKKIASKTNAYILDEGLNPCPPWDETFNKNFPIIIDNLKTGKDCIVIEIFYMIHSSRDYITDELKKIIPNIRIKWIYFENSIEKANKNCLVRALKGEKEDLNGNLNQNFNLTKDYEIPGGTKTIPIYQLKISLNISNESKSI